MTLRQAFFVSVYLQDMDMILIGAVFHWGAFSTAQTAVPGLHYQVCAYTGLADVGQHCQTSNWWKSNYFEKPRIMGFAVTYLKVLFYKLYKWLVKKELECQLRQ